MVEVIAIPNEVLNVLVLLSIIGIIGIFLVKLYNVLHKGEKFSIQISTIFFAVGLICYLFIEIGLFISIPLDVESTLIEYNFYLWFSRVFVLLIFIFWFVELIFNAIYTVKASLTEPTRMQKRRAERLNRY